MFNLEKITRQNVLNLKPYSSARDEFKGKAKIFLDANENAFGEFTGDFNRYPDPLQFKLKQKIAEMKTVNPNQIFLGNGSDEVIDLLFRAFCNPAKDNVILMPPTYGMYKVAADTNDIKIIDIPLNQDFEIDLANVKKAINEYTKLIFICSPNNPSGNRMNNNDIINILENFNGLLVLDEAYIDYADEKSSIDLIEKYPNLVVVQTFSKARGMASLRVGIAFTNKNTINALNKIKPPYNINGLSQEKILEALEQKTNFDNLVELIKIERANLQKELEELSFTKKIYPSQANFLLVKFNDAKKVYDYLAANGIIVRDRSNVAGCSNSLRITVGTPKENATLINTLRQWDGKEQKDFKLKSPDFLKENNKSPIRNAVVKRKTAETDIFINIHL